MVILYSPLLDFPFMPTIRSIAKVSSGVMDRMRTVFKFPFSVFILGFSSFTLRDGTYMNLDGSIVAQGSVSRIYGPNGTLNNG